LGTVTGTSITFSVNPSSTGAKAVVVTNADGGTTSTNVNVNALPTFTSVSPTTVRAGTAVTYIVTGTGFQSGATITATGGALNGTAPMITLLSSTQFKVVGTAGSTGSKNLRVSITNPDTGAIGPTAFPVTVQ
jgi:hypothetical protein